MGPWDAPPIGANLRRDRAANSSPPPCGEGSGVGVEPVCTAMPHGTTPHPDPPPHGGREVRAVKLALMRATPTHKLGLWAAAAAGLMCAALVIIYLLGPPVLVANPRH